MMINLLTNKYTIIVVLVVALFFTRQYYVSKLESTQNKLEVARNNEKAYQKDIELWKDRYGQEHAKSIMFIETVEGFKRATDSTSRRMTALVEQQNIKLKNLERLSYTKTSVNTVLGKDVEIPTMPDTILDLSTEWVKNKIHLSPLNVSSEISFINETLTTMTARKEPIAPRKKTFFGKLIQDIFAKKHIVVEGETIQTNPLVETKEQRFIHFYKD